MAAQLLDGKLMAAELEEELKTRVDALRQKGCVPGLTVILVGEDPASQTYVSNKEKACARLGIASFIPLSTFTSIVFTSFKLCEKSTDR